MAHMAKLCRRFSTKVLGNIPSKVYEYRVYSIDPKQFKSFLELTNEWIHLRTNHSPLVGYWVSEIGGINDVVHLWEYDNLEQRAAVRLALSQDPHWLSNYISKMMPMLVRQDNSLLQLVGTGHLSSTEQTGVYEIQQFTSPKNDKINQLKGEANLLGTFESIAGPMNTVYQLWRHSSLSDYLLKNSSVQESQAVRAGHSRLLIPTKWSPLQ